MKKFLAILDRLVLSYLTKVGLVLWDMGGGNSAPAPQAAPTSTNVTQTSIPEYARPYAETLLGQGQTLTDVNTNPYTPYSGQRVADFTPLQNQAINNIGNMGVADQTTYASNMTADVGQQAQGYQNYQAQQFNPGYNAGPYQSMGISALMTQAPQLQNYMAGAAQNQYDPNALAQYQMGGPQQVGTGQFTDPNTAASYMSPYMKNVVDYQTNEAIRDYRKTLPQEQAAAVRAGAFGGSREAINQSEMQRNLNTQLGGIAATGANNAYNAAQNAFMTDQARALQAQQSNQQAGLQTGVANLNSALQTQGLAANTGLQAALANQQAQQQTGLANQNAFLGVQQLGAQSDMQSQLANQQAQLSAQNQALTQNQQANAYGLQNAQNYAQYGLQGQQLGEQSRQFGANLGLQGLQSSLAAAGQLGNLGQNQYAQQLGINQAQQQAGALQQNANQQVLNNSYQDYANQMNYPYKQLGFMSDLLRGMPLTQQSSAVYQAPPTAASSLASLGLGAYGISSLLGGKKKGGVIKKMADGGLTSIANRMPDDVLQRAAKGQSEALDPITAGQILKQRGQLRTAAAGTLPENQGVGMLPAPNMGGFADGGIVGYAEGGYTPPRFEYAPYKMAGSDVDYGAVTPSYWDVSTPTAFGSSLADYIKYGRKKPKSFDEEFPISTLVGKIPGAQQPAPGAQARAAGEFGYSAPQQQPPAPPQKGVGALAKKDMPANPKKAAEVVQQEAEAYKPSAPPTLDEYIKQATELQAKMSMPESEELAAMRDKLKGKEYGINSERAGIMALKAAAAIGKPGQSTLAALSSGFGAAGESANEWAKIDEAAKHADEQMRMQLAIHADAVKRGDRDTALKAQKEYGDLKKDYDSAMLKKEEIAEMAKARKAATEAAMYGHGVTERVGMARVGAMEKAYGGAREDQQMSRLVMSLESQALNRAKAIVGKSIDAQLNPDKFEAAVNAEVAKQRAILLAGSPKVKEWLQKNGGLGAAAPSNRNMFSASDLDAALQ